MKTYIFFWNPEVSDVTMSLYEKMLNVKGNWCFIWHIHDHEHVKNGDKAFVVRCGEGNTGICASGWIIDDKFEDFQDSTPERKVFNVKMRPFVMIHPDQSPILSTSELQDAIPEFDWSGGMSGRMLNKKEAEMLEKLWNKFVAQHQECIQVRSYYSDSYHEYDEDDWEDYDTADLTMMIELNEEGKFYCDWYGKNDISVHAEGDTPKELKTNLFRALPLYIDRSEVEFSFEDEIQENNHDEIEKAIEIALEFHKGQKEQGGKPYITHLWRVMCKCLGDEENMVVALLKDTYASREYLLEHGISENAVQVLEEIRQKEGETYEDYIRRLRRSYVSKQVIEAELEDRLDLTTYKEVTDEDLKKIQQYKWAYDVFFPLPIKKKTI